MANTSETARQLRMSAVRWRRRFNTALINPAGKEHRIKMLRLNAAGAARDWELQELSDHAEAYWQATAGGGK